MVVRRRFWTGYLIVIHLLLAVMLIYSDFTRKLGCKFGMCPLPQEFTASYYDHVAFHQRVDQNLPEGAILFIGDSHIQGLAVMAVSPRAVNFGIGGDTTEGVMRRIKLYRSVSRAPVIVLEVGFNDLVFRNNDEIVANLQLILDYLKANSSATVLVNSVMPFDTAVAQRPFDNGRIRELNLSVRKLVDQYAKAGFVDIYSEVVTAGGELDVSLHIGDGIHLNARGYQKWIDILSGTISTSTDLK